MTLIGSLELELSLNRDRFDRQLSELQNNGTSIRVKAQLDGRSLEKSLQQEIDFIKRWDLGKLNIKLAPNVDKFRDDVAKLSDRYTVQVGLNPDVEKFNRDLQEMQSKLSCIKVDLCPDVDDFKKKLGKIANSQLDCIPVKLCADTATLQNDLQKIKIDPINVDLKINVEDFNKKLGLLEKSQIKPITVEITANVDQVNEQVKQIKIDPLSIDLKVNVEDFNKKLRIIEKSQITPINISIVAESAVLPKAILDDFEQVSYRVQEKWKETIAFIKAEFASLAQDAASYGYLIQKGVSEGSPGPSFYTRENWRKTISDVKSSMSELGSYSDKVGKNITGNLDKKPGKLSLFGDNSSFSDDLTKSIEKGFRNAQHKGLFQSLIGGGLSLFSGLGGLMSGLGKAILSPLKMAISGAFLGIGLPLGQNIGTQLSTKTPLKGISTGVSKIIKGFEVIDQEIIGKMQVYETFFAEILRSGQIGKASQVAFERTTAQKYIKRLQGLQKIATMPLTNNSSNVAKAIEELLSQDEELMSLYQNFVAKTNLTRSKNKQLTLESKAAKLAFLPTLKEEGQPKELATNIVLPMLKQLQPLLTFIQGMQSYNTSVLTQRFYNEKKPAFPLLDENEDVVSVMGGAQNEKGQGGRSIATSLESILPNARLLPVENLDTDNTDRTKKIDDWIKQSLGQLITPEMTDMVPTIVNAIRQIAYSLDPLASSVAAAQALAHTKLAQEQGKKGAAISYSLGGADAIRYAQTAEYQGIDTNTLAMAYPFLNLSAKPPSSFNSTLLEADPLSFPFKLGMNFPTQQAHLLNDADVGIGSSEVHGIHHLFKSPEFVNLLSQTTNQDIPDIPLRQLSDAQKRGMEIQPALPHIKSSELLMNQGKIDLSAIEKIATAIKIVKSMEKNGIDTEKVIAQKLGKILDNALAKIIDFLKNKNIALPDDLSDIKGYAKYADEAIKLNKVFESFKTGEIFSDNEAWFAGGLNVTSVAERKRGVDNEFLPWIKQENLGNYKEPLLNAVIKLSEIQAEFIRTGGNLSQEFKDSIQLLSVPNGAEELVKLAVNTSDVFPQNHFYAEQLRLQELDAPDVLKKIPATILAFNKMVESLGDVMPHADTIQSVAFGMSGASALMTKDLVYKTDLDPGGAEKIASKQEIESYNKLQGRYSPLLYAAKPGEALVTERIKGKSLKDVLSNLVKPIQDLQKELDQETDKGKQQDLKKKIQEAKRVFNQEAEKLYYQLGQLGAAMHEMGVAHNDLASGNVFFTEEGISSIDLGNAIANPNDEQKFNDKITAVQRALIDKEFMGILDPLKTVAAITSGFNNPLPIPEIRQIDSELLAPSVPGQLIPIGSTMRSMLQEVTGKLPSLPTKPPVVPYVAEDPWGDIPDNTKSVLQRLDKEEAEKDYWLNDSDNVKRFQRPNLTKNTNLGDPFADTIQNTTNNENNAISNLIVESNQNLISILNAIKEIQSLFVANPEPPNHPPQKEQKEQKEQQALAKLLNQNEKKQKLPGKLSKINSVQGEIVENSTALVKQGFDNAWTQGAINLKEIGFHFFRVGIRSIKTIANVLTTTEQNVLQLIPFGKELKTATQLLGASYLAHHVPVLSGGMDIVSGATSGLTQGVLQPFVNGIVGNIASHTGNLPFGMGVNATGAAQFLLNGAVDGVSTIVGELTASSAALTGVNASLNLVNTGLEYTATNILQGSKHGVGNLDGANALEFASEFAGHMGEETAKLNKLLQIFKRIPALPAENTQSKQLLPGQNLALPGGKDAIDVEYEAVNPKVLPDKKPLSLPAKIEHLQSSETDLTEVAKNVYAVGKMAIAGYGSDDKNQAAPYSKAGLEKKLNELIHAKTLTKQGPLKNKTVLAGTLKEGKTQEEVYAVVHDLIALAKSFQQDRRKLEDLEGQLQKAGVKNADVVVDNKIVKIYDLINQVKGQLTVKIKNTLEAARKPVKQQAQQLEQVEYGTAYHLALSQGKSEKEAKAAGKKALREVNEVLKISNPKLDLNVANNVSEKWEKASLEIAQDWRKLVAIAKETGIQLEHFLADRSPGPTKNIPQKWQLAGKQIIGTFAGILLNASVMGTQLENKLGNNLGSMLTGKTKLTLNGIAQEFNRLPDVSNKAGQEVSNGLLNNIKNGWQKTIDFIIGNFNKIPFAVKKVGQSVNQELGSNVQTNSRQLIKLPEKNYAQEKASLNNQIKSAQEEMQKRIFIVQQHLLEQGFNVNYDDVFQKLESGQLPDLGYEIAKKAQQNAHKKLRNILNAHNYAPNMAEQGKLFEYAPETNVLKAEENRLQFAKAKSSPIGFLTKKVQSIFSSGVIWANAQKQGKAIQQANIQVEGAKTLEKEIKQEIGIIKKEGGDASQFIAILKSVKSARKELEKLSSQDVLTGKQVQQVQQLNDKIIESHELLGKEPLGQKASFLDKIFNLQNFGHIFEAIKGFVSFYVFGNLGYQMIDIAKNTFGAYVEFDKFKTVLEYSVGSGHKVGRSLQFINQTVSDMKIPLKEAMQGYGKLLGSTKGNTALEGKTSEQLFTGISEASTVLGLTGEEQNGMILAISQMASKGRVMAEELRGQLAERVPGAMQIAARAMNVTTQELGKMMDSGELYADEFLPRFAKALHSQFGEAAKNASNNAQSAIFDFQNSWLKLQASVGEGLSPIVIPGTKIASEGLKLVTATAKDLGIAIAALSVGLAIKLTQSLITVGSNLILQFAPGGTVTGAVTAGLQTINNSFTAKLVGGLFLAIEITKTLYDWVNTDLVKSFQKAADKAKTLREELERVNKERENSKNKKPSELRKDTPNQVPVVDDIIKFIRFINMPFVEERKRKIILPTWGENQEQTTRNLSKNFREDQIQSLGENQKNISDIKSRKNGFENLDQVNEQLKDLENRRKILNHEIEKNYRSRGLVAPYEMTKQIDDLNKQITNLTEKRSDIIKPATKGLDTVEKQIEAVKSKIEELKSPEYLKVLSEEGRKETEDEVKRNEKILEDLKKQKSEFEKALSVPNPLLEIFRTLQIINIELQRAQELTRKWSLQEKVNTIENQFKNIKTDYFSNENALVQNAITEREKSIKDLEALKAQSETAKKLFATKDGEAALAEMGLDINSTLADIERANQLIGNEDGSQTKKQVLEQFKAIKQGEEQILELRSDVAQKEIALLQAKEQQKLNIIQKSQQDAEYKLKLGVNEELVKIKKLQSLKQIEEEDASLKLAEIQYQNIQQQQENLKIQLESIEKAYQEGVLTAKTYQDKKREINQQLSDMSVQMADQEIAVEQAKRQKLLAELEYQRKIREHALTISTGSATLQVKTALSQNKISDKESSAAIAKIQLEQSKAQIQETFAKLQELENLKRQNVYTDKEYAKEKMQLQEQLLQQQIQEIDNLIAYRQAQKEAMKDAIEYKSEIRKLTAQIGFNAQLKPIKEGLLSGRFTDKQFAVKEAELNIAMSAIDLQKLRDELQGLNDLRAEGLINERDYKIEILRLTQQIGQAENAKIDAQIKHREARKAEIKDYIDYEAETQSLTAQVTIGEQLRPIKEGMLSGKYTDKQFNAKEAELGIVISEIDLNKAKTELEGINILKAQGLINERDYKLEILRLTQKINQAENAKVDAKLKFREAQKTQFKDAMDYSLEYDTLWEQIDSYEKLEPIKEGVLSGKYTDKQFNVKETKSGIRMSELDVSKVKAEMRSLDIIKNEGWISERDYKIEILKLTHKLNQAENARIDAVSKHYAAVRTLAEYEMSREANLTKYDHEKQNFKNQKKLLLAQLAGESIEREIKINDIKFNMEGNLLDISNLNKQLNSTDQLPGLSNDEKKDKKIEIDRQIKEKEKAYFQNKLQLQKENRASNIESIEIETRGLQRINEIKANNLEIQNKEIENTLKLSDINKQLTDSQYNYNKAVQDISLQKSESQLEKFKSGVDLFGKILNDENFTNTGANFSSKLALVYSEYKLIVNKQLTDKLKGIISLDDIFLAKGDKEKQLNIEMKILDFRFNAENAIASQKLKSLENEQKYQQVLLQIDLQRTELQSKQAKYSAQKAELDAQNAVYSAKTELEKITTSTEYSSEKAKTSAIEDAKQKLDFAEQGLKIAKESNNIAQEVLDSQLKLVGIAKDLQKVQQEGAIAQFNTSEDARRQANELEKAQKSWDLMTQNKQKMSGGSSNNPTDKNIQTLSQSSLKVWGGNLAYNPQQFLFQLQSLSGGIERMANRPSTLIVQSTNPVQDAATIYQNMGRNTIKSAGL